MNPDFWQQRWHEGRIGFHQEAITPLLESHWDALQLLKGSRVFVPLAGKTLDMLWLAARGHRVLGVELSLLAIEQFFDEHQLKPATRESGYGVHYSVGAIELICGDAFALDAGILSDCDGVFDRAALIALPPEMRKRYANELYSRLPSGCRGLLITLEYPQQQKAGPPFSVGEEEVRELYGQTWNIDVLERRDILAEQPGFIEEGVTQLATVAYQLSFFHREKVPEGQMRARTINS